MQNPDLFAEVDWEALTDIPGGLPILPAAESDTRTLDEWLSSEADLSGGQQALAHLIDSSPPAVEKPSVLVFTPLSPREASGEVPTSDPARDALREIGLAVQADFNLARDSFRDAETGEHLLNGIFQREAADLTQDARPLLVALSPTEEGSFQAQAVEYGRTGSLAEVQADVAQVQTALEQGGVDAGITAIERLESELNAPAPHGWSLDIT